MKKRVLSLILAATMILTAMPLSIFASNANSDPQVTEQSFAGTVLKISTPADFQNGSLTNLVVQNDVGNGAVKLADGATEGVFVSAIYEVEDFHFNQLVATWNASLYDGTEVEIWGRVRTDAGQWSDWLSWDAFSPFILRGGNDNKGSAGEGVAYIDTEAMVVNEGLADAVQMKAEVRRSSADVKSPVLRQITVSTARADGDYIDPTYPKYDSTKTIKGKNEDNQEKEYEDLYTYAETPLASLPAKSLPNAVAYNQMLRHPDIGSDICNPTTVSVMMNSRVPALDLLPEEYAMNVRNEGEGIFGSWSYAVSGAGMYGFEAYLQYANLEILLQELAKGQACGISVKYQSVQSDDPNVTNIPYLEGAYKGTSGHIIALIGYEYEGETENGVLDLNNFDPEKLYIYSSDSFCDYDENAFRKYSWAQLEHCWKHNILYVIPSTKQEENVDVGAIVRIDAQLKADADQSNTYIFTDASGKALDMTRFISGQGKGKLAYTFTDASGKTLAAGEPENDGKSFAYPNNVRVTANNLFFYDNISCNSDGSVFIDTNAILRNLGVAEGTLTVYAMSDRGYRYTAQLAVEMVPEEIISTDKDITVGNTVTGNQVSTTVNGDGLTSDEITIGVWVPSEVGSVTSVSGTINGTAFTTDKFFNDTYGFRYVKITLDAGAMTAAKIVIKWTDTLEKTYQVSLIEITKEEDEIPVVKSESGSAISADLSSGRVSDDILQADGTISLKAGATYGEYCSPVYNTEKWQWEYALGYLNAYTPGTSSVDLLVRAYTERSQAWSDWYSFGNASVGTASVSGGGQDDYVNMDTDVFTMRGSSSIANGLKFQLKLVLTSDGKEQPVVHGAGLTVKKSSYSGSESDTNKPVELPESAEINVDPYNRYSYRVSNNNNIVYRENYPYKVIAWLMAMNAQGSDLLFEEVAFANYDWDLQDFNNWTMINYAPGEFGHKAYTQYGANATLIQQIIAAGDLPIVLASGAYLDGTSSNSRSITLVYGYYTAEDGTVMFKTLCPRGDISEMKAGDVYGEITADELNSAIAGYSSTGGRGAVYVVGAKAFESSWQRVEAKAVMTDTTNSAFTITVDGETLVLPEGFLDYSNFGKGGTIAYTLSSETDPDAKLAAGIFYYDIEINEDGTLSVPEALKAEVEAFGSANIYIICNNGVTYTATLKHGHTWDEGEVTTNPGCETEGEKTYHCTIEGCDEVNVEKIEATGHTPGAEATCTEGQKCTVCQKELAPATGVHTYEDGVCTGCGAKEPADTGDHAQPMLWAAVMAAALACVAVLLGKKKAEQK